MNAMAEMLSDMVMKAIPEDVRKLLTEENITNLQNNVRLNWELVKGSFVALLENDQTTHAMLVDLKKQLDRMEANVSDRDNGRSTGIGTAASIDGKPIGRVARRTRAKPLNNGAAN